MMDKTPVSLRRHVTIFGPVNAGKSTLFNAVLGHEMAIVSSHSGTTTDPVSKAMELIPYGPINLVDTAGLGDNTVLAPDRLKKTFEMIGRTDLAVYAADCEDFDEEMYNNAVEDFFELEVPHMLVFTKRDLAGEGRAEELGRRYPDALFVSGGSDEDIARLRAELSKRLSALAPQNENMLSGLVSAGDTVLFVIPLDSQAPRGRLIAPQVQALRDCLDIGAAAVCVRDTGLEEAMKNIREISLVVTDSQVFGSVSAAVPQEIKLTSFSILMARQKGDVHGLVGALSAIEKLEDGDIVLIAESCTHNVTHEDIGRVKIPALLERRTGKKLRFEFVAGHDFPSDLSAYKLCIHCGACMTTRRAFLTRQTVCKKAGIPMTNYGIFLSCLTGDFSRITI